MVFNMEFICIHMQLAMTKKKTLEDMAGSEAEHVLRMIKEAGAKPTMPVYYDIEDKSQVGMTTKQYGDMAEIFAIL